MPEILTQQEISTLLSEIPATGADADRQEQTEKNAAPYDFRSPERISPLQMQVATGIFKNAASEFATYLHTRLQHEISVTIASIDQIHFSEYLSTLSNPSCLYVVHFGESHLIGVIEMPPQLVIGIVSGLLGGTPDGSTPGRELTRLEQGLNQPIVNNLLDALQKSWLPVAKVNIEFVRFESEAEMLQITSPGETTLVVSFNVAIDTQKYVMRICLPAFGCESILGPGGGPKASGAEGKEPRQSSALFNSLKETTVVATGVLGTATLTLKEYMELAPGDVIRTDVSGDDEIQVHVGGKIQFWGYPGISNGRIAVRATRTVNDLGKDKK